MKQRSVPIQINIQRRYPLLADSHTVDLGRLPRIDTDIVRVERALSSESDPVTQSASFRTRTDSRDEHVDTRDAVATNSPSSSPHP